MKLVDDLIGMGCEGEFDLIVDYEKGWCVNFIKNFVVECVLEIIFLYLFCFWYLFLGRVYIMFESYDCVGLGMKIEDFDVVCIMILSVWVIYGNWFV